MMGFSQFFDTFFDVSFSAHVHWHVGPTCFSRHTKMTDYESWEYDGINSYMSYLKARS